MIAEEQRPGYFASWSGGKDACLAMHRIACERGAPGQLLTMLDETGERSRGHHLRPCVLAAQAEALGVPIDMRATTWEQYEVRFKDALVQMKGVGLAEGVFGDIDLAEHREWVERVCAETGVIAHEPLWLEEREPLIEEFLEAGYVAVIVGVKDGVLDSELLGRTLDRQLVDELTAAGVDACGELGEYHTLVIDGPTFRHRVELVHGEELAFDGYRFLDLTPRD